jgi:hypothetical protein
MSSVDIEERCVGFNEEEERGREIWRGIRRGSGSVMGNMY